MTTWSIVTRAIKGIKICADERDPDSDLEHNLANGYLGDHFDDHLNRRFNSNMTSKF